MNQRRPIDNPGLTRGLILAVLVAMLPLAVLSVLQGMAARTYAIEMTRNQLMARTAATADAVGDLFKVTQTRLFSYARDPDVVGITQNCSLALARSRRVAMPGMVMLVRWDIAGRPMCWSETGPVDKRLSLMGASSRATPGEGYGVSQPFASEIDGRRVIAVILPIRDAAGRPNGAITARLDADMLAGTLANARDDADTTALIVNATGKRVLGGGPGADLTYPAAPALKTIASVPAEPRRNYSTIAIEGAPLFVVHAEPAVPVFATSRSQLYLSLLLPLLAILAGCLILWVAVRRLVLRWLKRLAVVADGLRDGRYPDTRNHFAGAPYELAQLNEDLQDMAAAIQKRDRGLVAAAERNLALAMEVNHRVKNNLQIIVSLISMQRSNVKDETARAVLEQTRARVAGIGLIHRLLYDQRQGELGQITITELMAGLCEQLTRDLGNDRVDLQCTGGKGSVPLDQAVPLTLFLIEAVTNAYVHGYPGDKRGSIEVDLRREGASGRLTVTDHGVGYEQGGQAKTTGGTLMRTYVMQLHGELDTTTLPGEGVRLELRFPIRGAQQG